MLRMLYFNDKTRFWGLDCTVESWRLFILMYLRILGQSDKILIRQRKCLPHKNQAESLSHAHVTFHGLKEGWTGVDANWCACRGGGSQLPNNTTDVALMHSVASYEPIRLINKGKLQSMLSLHVAYSLLGIISDVCAAGCSRQTLGSWRAPPAYVRSIFSLLSPPPNYSFTKKLSSESTNYFPICPQPQLRKLRRL